MISENGEIVTNAHVVTDADSGGGGPIHEAEEVFVEFADRNRCARTSSASTLTPTSRC